MLTFQLAKPYSIFCVAREAVRREVGALEPLNFPLAQVKSDVFERAISVWSGIRESNPHLELGKLAYYHCTNPARMNSGKSIPIATLPLKEEDS